MLCPLAVYRPVVNHGGPMGSVRGLCMHVQEGDGSLFGYFDNPASQVSSHFWMAKNGYMEQYLEVPTHVNSHDGETAWAEAAGNPNYLSVETEGFATENLTTIQLVRLAALVNWCAAMYAMPVVGPVEHGAAGFTPHCNPDGTPDPGWGNHTCPGPIRLSQMHTVLAIANGTDETGDETMTSVELNNGKVLISTCGGGARAGNLLLWTFDPATQKVDSVIDATLQVPDPSPYLVMP